MRMSKSELSSVLGESAAGQLNAVLTGTLRTIDLIEMDRMDLRIKEDFWPLFFNPTTRSLGENYFRPASKSDVPLSHHFVPDQDQDYLRRLLQRKPETSTHLLLYGLPGSGKTSFAVGLAGEIGVPVYEIVRNEQNKAATRRAAIVACLNLTSGGEGAIVIVDEADNLLNTDHAWQMRGETQDKGWLNELLETPAARMIWIVNRIDDIDPSVMRRFTYSIRFQTFNRRQRCLLWERILRRHHLKRYFGEKEIADLAARHPVSAGAIDLTVKKAVESCIEGKLPLRQFIDAALKAHQTLMEGGVAPADRDRQADAYSIEGLNTDADLGRLQSTMERFDRIAREPQRQGPRSLTLLFSGPPGAGKSALARHLADGLQRACHSRSMSDLLDPYVGMTEKNIRQAFERAEAEEAVLVIDVVDSLLYPRNLAQRSWEVSHTNEFLARMESFRGILICTTNRFEDLDAASIRRFNFKVRFDYLTPEGIEIFYRRCLAPLTEEPITAEQLGTLKMMRRLTPGDFGLVRQRFLLHAKEQVNHYSLIDALGCEEKVKNVWASSQIVGFRKA